MVTLVSCTVLKFELTTPLLLSYRRAACVCIAATTQHLLQTLELMFKFEYMRFFTKLSVRSTDLLLATKTTTHANACDIATNHLIFVSND